MVKYQFVLKFIASRYVVIHLISYVHYKLQNLIIVKILDPRITVLALLVVAYISYCFIPDLVVVNNQVDLIKVVKSALDNVQAQLKLYNRAAEKYNELKAIENSWIYSLTQTQKDSLNDLSDFLGVKDISEVSEIKIRDVSRLLNKTFFDLLKELEDALYSSDMEAMENFQMKIDKEQLEINSLLPIKSKVVMSESTELETKNWFDALLDLLKALAVSKDTYKLLNQIFLS